MTVYRWCKKNGIKSKGNGSNLRNKRSGKLLFVDTIHKTNDKKWIWLCQCDCGNTIYLLSKDFNVVKDCGCSSGVLKRKSLNRHLFNGVFKTETRLYGIWRGMKTRCTINDSFTHSWDRYGGRGIRVCFEWSNSENGFYNFKKWSNSNGYTDKLTIDRIDNDGNYEPSNCKWSTNKEQARNKSTNVLIEYLGEIKPMCQWCEEYGISKDTFRVRIKKLNWTLDKALTTPVAKYKTGRS